MISSDIYMTAMDKRFIPDYMRPALERWIMNGEEPGGFLQAVLKNNLFDAFGKADDTNLDCIKNYLMFLYNDAPSQCYGSLEKYHIWANQGGLLGHHGY